MEARRPGGVKGKLYLRVLIFAALAVLLTASGAEAEYGRTPTSTIDPELVRIDDRDFLGTALSGDYKMLGSDGAEFELKEFFGKPTVLVFSYFNCDGACPVSNKELREVLGKAEGIGTRLGKDYRVLTLSFDLNDDVTSTAMFEKMVASPDESIEGWRFAVMSDGEDIKEITGQLGYKFFWSPRDKIFIHSMVHIFLTPEGRVARYLYSANLGSTDVRAAVAEAGFGKTTSSRVKDLADVFLVACYSYNYKEGKYTLNIPLFIATGSLAGVVLLTVFGFIVFKRKKRRYMK